MPKPPKFKVHDRVGRLLLLTSLRGRDGRTIWDCVCDCGTRKLITHKSLCINCKSCGCLAREKIAERNTNHGPTKHGHAPSKSKPSQLYNTWRGMCERITSDKHKDYHNYGGKGITMEPLWTSFEAFLIDMEKGWFPNAHLHRLDNNLGYFKDNVAWIDRSAHTRLHHQLRRKEKAIG